MLQRAGRMEVCEAYNCSLVWFRRYARKLCTERYCFVRIVWQRGPSLRPWHFVNSDAPPGDVKTVFFRRFIPYHRSVYTMKRILPHGLFFLLLMGLGFTTQAQVRINEVGYAGVDFMGATKWVELYNAGDSAEDVSELYLCNFPTYSQICLLYTSDAADE